MFNMIIQKVPKLPNHTGCFIILAILLILKALTVQFITKIELLDTFKTVCLSVFEHIQKTFIKCKYQESYGEGAFLICKKYEEHSEFKCGEI